LTKPPMRTTEPSASDSAVEYHRDFCMDSTVALSNHWHDAGHDDGSPVQGLSTRMALVPS
jgi:hypothetical protein